MKKQLALFFLYYLRFFARLQLRKNPQATIIGITGTAGKSSTRNALYALLKSHYRVKVSFGANSESGIPLDILGLSMKNYSFADWFRVACLAPWQLLTYSEKFDCYIVEMGIDSPLPPKNMTYLLSIVHPQIGVILNAKAGHSFAFDPFIHAQQPAARLKEAIRLIAQEKSKLIQSLPQSGLAVINADDTNLVQLNQHIQAPAVTFGYHSDATCQLQAWQVSLQKQQVASEFRFRFRNLSPLLTKTTPTSKTLKIVIKNYLLAPHYAESFAAAILVAQQLGISLDECQTALEQQFQLPPGRASLLAGINHSLLLDSTYNASSMSDFIALVKQIPFQGRKLAVLGDMRELGEETRLIHEQIAEESSKVFTHIFLLGPAMVRYALPILQQHTTVQVSVCANALEAGDEVKKLLQPGDFVLIKGSQNTLYLEETVKKLLANPQQANQSLCRQSPYWQHTKAAFFAQMAKSPAG